MAEDIRISVGADTTQMESQIANAARKATVVIRPTIDSKGLEKISAPLGRITGQADEFSKSMEAANARVLAFGASVGVLNAVAKSFQNIVTASTQVEASLKEIQVATGETSGNLEKLGKGIFEVARSTGLSFKQASEATLEFARQGGTLEDSLMKAKAALVLTRTTGLDAAEAVKGLTAAVLSFNQVGLDYETVVNKLAAVDTKFAVSSRDLIEGISRSASVAQEAGVSFDELTALITTLQEKTARGGAVIGNALKTIFQRVQTTENLDYIRNLGIAVNDVSGDILPATTIIKKLANEFQNLDSATRKGLLIKIGGGFQIDKLAALLNDISSANGTFNRSLTQSTNAGNQGFQKLEELNKTVQASFDRLTTSGTQFAATIGKIAFSDDFRSILNKTSSFLESLNESISGGEEGGATIGKSIVKGIGSIITGPGALLLAGLGIKLFADLAKFGVDSLKNQLGVTNVKKEQQDIEKSILGLLLQNTTVQSKIVALEGNKAAQAEYLLGLYSKQAATLERMSKLSKEIGPSVYEGGIRLTTEGTKNVKTAADGFMPLGDAISSERKNAPAGSRIILDSSFPLGGGKTGPMVYNSSETRIKNFANGGDAIIPNFASKPVGQIQTNEVAGLTIGGNETSIQPRRIEITSPNGTLTKLGQQLSRAGQTDIVDKYSSIQFAQPIPVGNIYRRGESLSKSEEKIKDDFRERLNQKLSPEISSTIQSELDLLGITPTEDIARSFKVGRRFNLVGKSEAGLIFENMVKIANLSSSEISKFAGSDNQPFDIYNLKESIGKQYFGNKSKGAFKYVEVRSDSSSLKEALTKKYIEQAVNFNSPELLANITGKTAANGYIPNFAGTTNFEGSASRYGKSIARVYDQGEEALKATLNNPKTAFSGTLTGKAGYGNEIEKYGYINVDENAIIASILGNNTFVAGNDQQRTLESLAIRLTAQDATVKGSGMNFAGLQISRLATNPYQAISADIKGKFKKIEYEKLKKILPRFWKTKGLGDVWEKSKLFAAYKTQDAWRSKITQNLPELEKFFNSKDAIRENNALLRNAAIESVLKKDPSIAGFLVDIKGSSDEQYLKQQGFGDAGIKYAMPFSGASLSNVENLGIKEEKIQSQLDAKRKADQYRSKIESFQKNGVLYKDYVNNKSGYGEFGRWGNYDQASKRIFLVSTVAKTAAKGYIPNFSREAILDAIGREQTQSGLPLSAIKVVQDARVRGPQNPNGYAVINNRDEPDGRVPNFAKEGYTKEKFIEEEIRSISKSFTDFNQAVKEATDSLNSTYTESFGQIKVTAEEVANLLSKIKNEGVSGGKIINRTSLNEQINSALGSPDSKKPQADKEQAEAQAKQTKTVQDSLYTLLKWQTVIAGVTGALSAFGGDIAKGSEAVGSLFSSFIAVREGKGIAGEFLGKNKQGEQASIKDAFNRNIEGKGALAGVGAILATGGTYIAAGVAAVQALDGAIQILAKTSEKSQASIEELSALNDKYNAGLTETQKRISANIAESGKVTGAGIGGFLNRSGISTIFSSADIQELTKAIATVQTGRNEQASEVLVKSFSDRLIPIVEQRMREENPGVEKFSTSAVKQNVNFTIAKMLNDIDKQATVTQTGIRPLSRKDIEGTDFQIELENQLIKKEKELEKIKENIIKLDLKSAENGYRTNSEQSKYNKLLIDSKKIQEEIASLTTATGIDEQKRQELIVKYLKDLERPAQELAYAEATRQEAMLINANLLKAELDASTKLAQLEISRISPRENALSIEKELLSTSETRRAAVELELKQLEEQRRLRAEIKNIAATTGLERVNQYIGFTGSTLTKEKSDTIQGGFQEILNAPAGEENKAIEDFLKILQPIKQDQETLTAQVRERIDGYKAILDCLKVEEERNKEEIKSKEEQIVAEEAKLQTMNAQNEIARQLLAIFTLQVNVAKQTSKDREKNNAREALNKAIVDQQNNALKMQKDILTTRLDLEQKSLQYNKERLGILRDIADINFERSTLEMPEGPMKDYLSALQQASSQAQKAFDDLENRKKEKSLTDEKSLTSYITSNTNDREILKQVSAARGNVPELEKIAKTAIDAQNTTFEDKVINAAKEFEKIVTRAGNTVAGKPETNAETKNTITPQSSIKDVLATDFTKTSDVKQLEAAKAIMDRDLGQSIDPEKYKEINTALEESIKLKKEFGDKTVENLYSGAIPELETIQKIKDNYALLVEKAEQRKRLETGFSGGLETSMRQINQELDSFDNRLGKQIPLDFRNGLVDAMKALSDPNATTSLKERLMGVATSFLNKINEAFMQNTANKITQNIGNFFNQGGGQGFASGGAIKGGSGTKDDVPAMLMGGEYVIKKNVVNKYGKDFFDRLNAGKIKGFANGGMAGFDIADNKDTVLNPTKYIPYGQARAGGLSFDDSGKVIGMDSYTGTEENKNKALLEAQTKFYQGGAQTGEGGFFMPGTYGRGAIMGQQNLLNYATQQTTGTQFDKFSNTGGASSIDIAAGSSNLSLFALRDQGNLKNAEYLESKNKALDLYLGGIGAEKDKIRMDEENRKQYEELKKQIEDAKKQAKKQLVTQLVTAVASAAISAAASSMAKGWNATNQASGGKASFGEKFSGMFTGGTMGGESRGGLANMFSSSGYKDFSVIGKAGGGLQEWNSSLGGYTDMSPLKYESMYQPLQNAGRLSYDSLGSPVINSFRGPSSGFNLLKINPMNWFGNSGASNRSVKPMGGLDMSNMGFGGVTSDQAFPSPLDSVVGMTPAQKSAYIRSQMVRKAAGGTIQGNGMGDNVPAMLNGGEFVMSRQASQRIGYGNLQQMNSSNAGAADSEGIASRLETKLEELIEKVTGVGTINITVTSDGKGGRNESENSNNQDQQNKEMARRMKEVVLGVLRDEKRLGGLLR
jgi:TP901 family phage tail tape measure protein